MPHKSCPAVDNCDRFCDLNLENEPCVCEGQKDAADGDVGELVGDTGEVEEEGGDDIPTVVMNEQSDEEGASQILVDTAEEEIDEATVVLEAIEEEQKIAAEIEELRAKIAKLEAVEEGGLK